MRDGIFAVDGEKWRHQKKENIFSTRRVSSHTYMNGFVYEINLGCNRHDSTWYRSRYHMSGNEEGIRFSDAFDDASSATLYRVADIFWKIKRFLNIGTEAVISKNIKVMHNFIYNLINRKIETLHKSEEDEQLAKETDPKYLRDMVLSFIAAGKDTTASALSWFIYMMCKNLDIQEKIAQEVREATGLNNTSSADEVAANLTEEVLSK
ncbi:hypothetical protein ACLB2K_075098 [Fragaria x ananassa]